MNIFVEVDDEWKTGRLTSSRMIHASMIVILLSRAATDSYEKLSASQAGLGKVDGAIAERL